MFSEKEQVGFASYVIKVFKCSGLIAKDRGGTSDPYVKIKVGEAKSMKTRTMEKDLNPTFEEEFRIMEWDTNEALVASVWDWNRITGDTFLGQINMPHPTNPSGVTAGTFELKAREASQDVSGTMTIEVTDVLQVQRYAKEQAETIARERQENQERVQELQRQIANKTAFFEKKLAARDNEITALKAQVAGLGGEVEERAEVEEDQKETVAVTQSLVDKQTLSAEDLERRKQRRKEIAREIIEIPVYDALDKEDPRLERLHCNA